MSESLDVIKNITLKFGKLSNGLTLDKNKKYIFSVNNLYFLSSSGPGTLQDSTRNAHVVCRVVASRGALRT